MASKNSFNYQTRLFLLIVVFTWVLTFAFFMLQYTREKEYKADTLNAQLQVYNRELLRAIERDSLQNFADVTKDFRADSMRVTIVDMNGQVLYDSNGDMNYSNHSRRNEISEAAAIGVGYTIRRQSETDSRYYFYSATRGKSLIVRSALPYNSSLYADLKIDSVYIWLILVIAVVVSIIAYFAARRIGRNIKNLRDFAEQAESGNALTYDTDSFPDDELGEISKNIINLYKNLKVTAQERDENLRNAMFEEQEKVRIKHQLTNNINHEIKNPVHAIQACLETIINNKDRLDHNAIFELLQRAYDNVNRLCSLLHDISIITRISEASDKIEKQIVDVSRIIDDVKSSIAVYPPEKQMRINVNVPEGVAINGNESLVESIFSNLVNNSIAYSGGRDIFISLDEETPEYYRFTFADNGVGVSEEHINRLFERFYRVDEGRSRKVGGTGLGLAIVKNAVLFHQGTISVKNRHAGGLEFTFTLHK